jgi:DNA-binding NarL/FixJ family response regulator
VLPPSLDQHLRLLAAGRSHKEIAQLLGLAEGTTKIHVSAILKALGGGNRTEATVHALSGK